jgi:hypothetical protein
MRSIFIKLSVFFFVSITFSCGNSGKGGSNPESSSIGKITQGKDGTFDLNIEKASRYSDHVNPACNTAEWSIVVSKPGRYKVWLSSATTDTMDLQYSNSVKISLLDERLDVKPVSDKIVRNTTDVKYPYFRADSFMGTFYIQEAGEYNLQVISEKISGKSENDQANAGMDHTKLMSVILTPVTR